MRSDTYKHDILNNERGLRHPCLNKTHHHCNKHLKYRLRALTHKILSLLKKKQHKNPITSIIHIIQAQQKKSEGGKKISLALKSPSKLTKQSFPFIFGPVHFSYACTFETVLIS